jgi:RHS repeat-associated protein
MGTPTPASSVTVNGLPAQTYADFTFASLYGYTLADGQNSFTNVATNYYGTASVTNVVTANLPASLTLQYDPNGNLTNDGSRSFGYDAENELTNVTAVGQWREDFIYDGLSRRRITREFAWQSGAWVLTNETRFIYDGNTVTRQLDGNNVAQINYTRWLGGLLARSDTAASYFYHADGNQNITALMDVSQYIVARYLYAPFGQLTGKWGTLARANAYRFASEESDEKSGLYYLGRRYYDPNLQRFISRDPIQETGGLNTYAYCGNNPVSLIDILGLCYHYSENASILGLIPAPSGFVPYVFGDTIAEQIVSQINNLGYLAENAALNTIKNVGMAADWVADELGLTSFLGKSPTEMVEATPSLAFEGGLLQAELTQTVSVEARSGELAAVNGMGFDSVQAYNQAWAEGVVLERTAAIRPQLGVSAGFGETYGVGVVQDFDGDLQVVVSSKSSYGKSAVNNNLLTN